MNEEHGGTPSEQGGRPGHPRRRTARRNGTRVTPDRRHQRDTPPPADQPQDTSPSSHNETDEASGTDLQPPANPGGRRRLFPNIWRFFWFHSGATVHNTALAVAYIGVAGTVGTAVITVVGPAAVSMLPSLRQRPAHSVPRTTSILHAPHGVVEAYEHPSRHSRPFKARRWYREGETVQVTCQIRDGEPISDPGDGRPDYTVSAWDQLPNGSWIPDIYTNLPGKRGFRTPRGIPVCNEGSVAPVP